LCFCFFSVELTPCWLCCVSVWFLHLCCGL
jgi:hypothetical protein